MDFNGAIGTATNGILGTLTVNAGGDTSAGNITFATSADVGTATAAGAASLVIGNGSTATLAINGADYNTSGVQTYTANAFTLSGTDPDFNTTNSNVSFVDGADL